MSNRNFEFMIEKGNIDFGVVNTMAAVIEDIEIPSEYNEFVEGMRRVAEANAIANTTFQQNPIVLGYRALYKKLGYKTRDIIPAGEGLVRLIQKRGAMPRVNAAVDAYNSIVVERLLGIGAHDLATVRWPILFTQAKTEESFTPIGRGTDAVRVGDFLYRDTEKILCRLAAHDCDEAKLTSSSKGVVLVSEGNPATSIDFVRTAVEEACRRITAICGGTYTIYHPKVMA